MDSGGQPHSSFAKLGATVLVHGRDSRRIDAVLGEVAKVTGRRDVKGYRADFTDLAEVRKFAEDVITDNERLDLLINNAGIGAGNVKANSARREVSADGFELRFAVNYLAPFLLTRLLVPLLRQSAPSRIINVASIGQIPIDFGDVMLERRYESYDAYRQSKLGQIMDTIELATQLKESGITVNCLHPASLMNTKMVREWVGRPMSTVQDGVDALMHMATSPEFDQVTGTYYDQKTRARANAQAYDPDARARLKKLSVKITGL